MGIPAFRCRNISADIGNGLPGRELAAAGVGGKDVDGRRRLVRARRRGTLHAAVLAAGRPRLDVEERPQEESKAGAATVDATATGGCALRERISALEARLVGAVIFA